MISALKCKHKIHIYASVLNLRPCRLRSLVCVRVRPGRDLDPSSARKG